MNNNLLSFTQAANPLQYIALMIALAVIPLLLMGLTSYLKLSIVFNILRTALGAGQLPSAAITGILSLVLTLNIMAPVFSKVALECEKLQNEGKTGPEPNTLERARRIAASLSAPLSEFLREHSGHKERVFFSSRAPEAQAKAITETPQECQSRQCELANETFFSLMGAFVLSELRAGFLAGFLLCLPFLVVDLAVANLLVGMGMNMLNPSTLAVPLKILLFVAFDAWFELSKALIASY